MSHIKEELIKLKDENNAAFQAKLTPTIEKEKFLGIKVPVLRKLAKEIEKTDECESFIKALPHEYYDENMLHSILLAHRKPFDESVNEVEAFLPYIDNWAVCDTLKPKAFEKAKDELLLYIKKWVASKETYTIRFGVSMLMTHFLDKDFKEELLDIPAAIESDEYYVKMMVAWFFATALAKQWECTVPYIEKHILPDWTHQKAIQKARESYRISEEQKAYLKSLK